MEGAANLNSRKEPTDRYTAWNNKREAAHWDRLLWLLSVVYKMKMINSDSARWLGGNDGIGWKVQERLDR